MGHYTGWIALEAGIAGGADIVLVPEYPIKIDDVCEALHSRHRRGKTFSLIVVSEGANIEGYSLIQKNRETERRKRLTNIGEILASLIEQNTGYETRVSVLGHIQRGGSPSAYDRMIGTQFGVKAVDLVKEQKFGQMVSLHDGKIRSVDISLAVKKRKTIDDDVYKISKIFTEA